jgi:hypothetical protein
MGPGFRRDDGRAFATLAGRPGIRCTQTKTPAMAGVWYSLRRTLAYNADNAALNVALGRIACVVLAMSGW